MIIDAMRDDPGYTGTSFPVGAVSKVNSVGGKYQRSRDVKDIAKLYRADVKAAVAEGKIPKGTKVSVTISRYSMGQSITVYVTPPPGFPIYNPERVKFDAERHEFHERIPSLRAPEMERLVKTLDDMLAAYNYDNSDLQSDYFDSEFYGNVTEIGMSEDKERLEAALKTLPSDLAEPCGHKLDDDGACAKCSPLADAIIRRVADESAAAAEFPMFETLEAP